MKIETNREHSGFWVYSESAIIEFSLIVDNPTHRPLKVASVSASCGCTVPEVGHSAKVDPNGLLTIPVKWTLPAGPGPKTSNILLSFEDNEEQGRQYSLYAEVPETHPTEFDIGVLGPPPIDKEFAFLITAFPGEQDFSIINTLSSSDSISIIGVEPEESGFRLAVRYSAYAPHQVKEVISIETIDSIQALLNVKITGRVVDYIELEEKVLYLGVASPSEPRSGEMRLLSSPRELSDKLVILDSNFKSCPAEV